MTRCCRCSSACLLYLDNRIILLLICYLFIEGIELFSWYNVLVPYCPAVRCVWSVSRHVACLLTIRFVLCDFGHFVFRDLEPKYLVRRKTCQFIPILINNTGELQIKMDLTMAEGVVWPLLHALVTAHVSVNIA